MAEPHTIDYVTPGRFFCLRWFLYSNHYSQRAHLFRSKIPRADDISSCQIVLPSFYMYVVRLSVLISVPLFLVSPRGGLDLNTDPLHPSKFLMIFLVID